MKEILTAPRSPWQNICCERLVGSILDFGENTWTTPWFSPSDLCGTLQASFDYYLRSRTPLALGKDAPSHVPFSLQSLAP